MKNTTRNYVRVLIANALLVAVVAGIWIYRTQVMTPTPNPVPIPGRVDVILANAAKITLVDPPRPLPDLRYLANMQTDSSLADLKGQWTLVNLWATWCAPCKAELPSLSNVQNAFQSKGLRVLPISIDQADDAESFAKILQSHNYPPFTWNWDDRGMIYINLNPRGVPATYLIDPAGNIRGIIEGERDWSGPQMQAFFNVLFGS